MLPLLRFLFAVSITVALAMPSVPSLAQSGGSKQPDKPALSPAGEAAKEAQRRINEFAEASRLISGPAGNPECVWLGRRVIGLLWRDDLDTAFRHIDLYDRFGCPGPHIQAAFRCLIRQGYIDPRSPQILNARVHSCWVNPASPPVATSAPTEAPATKEAGATRK